jgi:soluble lytic murein transglycosylase-like protein
VTTFARAAAVACGALAALAALPSNAHAELVTFTTGRTMSVASHRQDGERLVFSLRSGGEMSVDAALVETIGPDEVPYPEPVTTADVPPAVATPLPLQTLRVDPAFDPIIRRVAEEKGVDPTLVRAVIQVESGYQPRARSSKGAVGLMQVMPATARQYGVRNLYDPSANIRAGVSHLKSLLDRFPLALALAAYNAGEAAVERFAGIPPYPETVTYVARIRALAGR